MPLLSGAQWRTYGRGEPTTLVVHGLGATDGEARIPASGLPGTRVVLTLPSHGHAPEAPADYWHYHEIADDVLAAADEVGATRAIGVSLGAGALSRLAATRPARFERLALLLPASLDQPRLGTAAAMFARLAAAADTATSDGGAELRELVAREVPANVDVGDYVSRRAAALARLGTALRSLPGQSALTNASKLASVRSPVLVIGATEDPLHPREVATTVASAFPHAELTVLPSAAPMLTHRRELRDRLSEFIA